jgi:hypothetical protein
MRRERALKVHASLLPKQRKPIPHAFVLDPISTPSPYTRPMETCRLDRALRQEFDGNLRNARPRRSFLWRKHNPEEISEGAVRRDERSHRGYAKAGVGSCG